MPADPSAHEAAWNDAHEGRRSLYRRTLWMTSLPGLDELQAAIRERSHYFYSCPYRHEYWIHVVDATVHNLKKKGYIL